MQRKSRQRPESPIFRPGLFGSTSDPRPGSTPRARRVGAAVGASFQPSPDYAPAAKRAQVRPQPCPWQIVTRYPGRQKLASSWEKCAKTHDARAREVGLRHSSCETDEQSGANTPSSSTRMRGSAMGGRRNAAFEEQSIGGIQYFANTQKLRCRSALVEATRLPS